jgi:hypothetical protein
MEKDTLREEKIKDMIEENNFMLKKILEMLIGKSEEEKLLGK